MRIGIIGHGAIGRHLVSCVHAADGLELAFVAARQRVDGVPWIALDDLVEEHLNGVDLVIEAAHPAVVAERGPQLLEHADLMVVSAGGLVDDDVREQLVQTARRHGSRLIMPYGALAGLEALASRPGGWRSAEISFVKPPHAFEPRPQEPTGRTVLYDGPVRGIAARYPRNVNAMVTFALATAGLDQTRALLISDPNQEMASLDFTALADDGGTLRVAKSQPLIGVSGSEMPDAIAHSLAVYAGGSPGLWFG